MAAQLILRAARRLLCGCAVAVLCADGSAVAAQPAPALANGVFLVAKPALTDPHFRETVVLITELEAGGGPVGVIINRPLKARLSEAVPGLRVPPQFDHVFVGGPVGLRQLVFLVRSKEPLPHSLPVLADVYLSGDRTLLENIMRDASRVSAFRAYIGYAGWAPGQLDVEIAAGGWYVVPADAATIFSSDPDKMWPELIHRAATQYTGVPAAGRQTAALAVR
ncbi:MAG TPA: YqgE/AlgH family protein [Burkholderiales bacterium]|nr:YqgE/AlgH family protein [Burkholderiales bacterium]